MDVISGILVLLMLWWVALFAVLPCGALKRDECGRPDDPQLGRKLLLTTILAFVLWGGVYVLIKVNVIDFRKVALSMREEERRE